MTRQSIAIVGGGPGGLLLAALLDTRRFDVTVDERNRADDTFGFGVVFSDRTLESLEHAAPALRAALSSTGEHWDSIEVRAGGERFRCGGNGMSAIARRQLLGVLRQLAENNGARLRFANEVTHAELDASIVVAADGTNSAARDAVGDLGCTVETAAAKYIWFGTTQHFEGLTFLFERTEHGTFAAHAYPIGGGVSTFIVETDHTTWRQCELDGFGDSGPPGSSDLHSLAVMRHVFARQLDGNDLLANNSRWANFRTRRCGRWWTTTPRPIVFLGDTVHTAHFSVGSGTKMAMDDAVLLAAELNSADLRTTDSIAEAFARYEAAARPSVTAVQDAARPSLAWWEDFGLFERRLPPWQFAYHFLTRSITDDRLGRRDRAFVQEVHDRWRGTTDVEPKLDAVTRSGRIAFRLDDIPFGGDVTVIDATDELSTAEPAAARVTLIRGGDFLARRRWCEHVRLDLGRIAVHVDPEISREQALTELVSGRADAVLAAELPENLHAPESIGLVVR